jgi:enoyl-CoA hydratase
MSLVSCEIDDEGVALLTMDDGKVNVLSPAMQADINAALDRAEEADAVPVLTGRERVFSGGFDLGTLRGGGEAGRGMLRGGFELAERILSFPRPVVMACNGHAIAMGLFLMISGDYRLGIAGPAKLTANEVAIGLTLPQAAIDICHVHLQPAYLSRILGLAEVFAPDAAVAAGMLDRVVEPSDLQAAARDVARQLAQLDGAAHRTTKLRVRAASLAALRASIAADFGAAAG